MRLGKITFEISYVVDLDNQDMVEDAKQCVNENVHGSVKHNSVYPSIKILTEDNTLRENDIPRFLLPEEE